MWKTCRGARQSGRCRMIPRPRKPGIVVPQLPRFGLVPPTVGGDYRLHLKLPEPAYYVLRVQKVIEPGFLGRPRIGDHAR